jgi:hypothetical protein
MRAIVAVVPLLMAFVHSEPTRAVAESGHVQMRVEVARVDVWFDAATRDALQRLAAGQRYSDELAAQIARVAVQARDVQVQVELLRAAAWRGMPLQAGDRVICRARGRWLQTIVVSGNRLLLDAISDDPRAGPAMIARYLAEPGIRDALIESLSYI